MRQIKWNPFNFMLETVLTQAAGKILISDGMMVLEHPVIKVNSTYETEWEDQVVTEKIIFNHMGDGVYEGTIL